MRAAFLFSLAFFAGGCSSELVLFVEEPGDWRAARSACAEDVHKDDIGYYLEGLSPECAHTLAADLGANLDEEASYAAVVALFPFAFLDAADVPDGASFAREALSREGGMYELITSRIGTVSSSRKVTKMMIDTRSGHLVTNEALAPSFELATGLAHEAGHVVSGVKHVDCFIWGRQCDPCRNGAVGTEQAAAYALAEQGWTLPYFRETYESRMICEQ